MKRTNIVEIALVVTIIDGSVGKGVSTSISSEAILRYSVVGIRNAEHMMNILKKIAKVPADTMMNGAIEWDSPAPAAK